jgi:hypothetical protein
MHADGTNVNRLFVYEYTNILFFKNERGKHERNRDWKMKINKGRTM